MLRKEEKADMSSSIPKPATNVKGGKSVRTNRSKGNRFQIHTDDDIVETRSKLGTNEMNANAADELSDTEPHSGEVDRKAEEFIAKFKEQIWLQKVASARKSEHRTSFCSVNTLASRLSLIQRRKVRL
ncbi:hypothetical protein Hanom_Chr16g01522321 [Helianthus anomalus]